MGSEGPAMSCKRSLYTILKGTGITVAPGSSVTDTSPQIIISSIPGPSAVPFTNYDLSEAKLRTSAGDASAVEAPAAGFWAYFALTTPHGFESALARCF